MNEGIIMDMFNEKEFLKLVQEARDEWIQAQNYFENVSEPELVDYAIYRAEAAKRRYMYLLKQARIYGLENRQVIQGIEG